MTLLIRRFGLRSLPANENRNSARSIGSIAVLSASLAFPAVVSTGGARAADNFWPATPTLEMFAPEPIATTPTLRIGAYIGALS
jgi:hypothetical protein